MSSLPFPHNFPKSIHFIGIGGIGMSGLASFCLASGCRVQGTTLGGDSRLLQRLIRGGAHIFCAHQHGLVDETIDCVVISSAIQQDNPEILDAGRLGIPILHRSDMLRMALAHLTIIAVSGTHGKTTTTSLLASVLEAGQKDPLVFCGGIMQQYQSNVRLGNAPWAVVEADESDKSFLNFSSTWAVIATSMEAEHMENYGSMEVLRESFRTFLSYATHVAVVCWDDQELRQLLQETPLPHQVTYGFLDGAQVQAHNVRYFSTHTVFDMIFHNTQEQWRDVHLALKGAHNVLNALATVSTARSVEIGEIPIRRALAQFPGVERRMTSTGVVHGVEIFDDYAHHPTEISTVLQGVRRTLPPGARLFAVCQPHRYTRLHALMEEFSGCFSHAHEVLLLPTYGAFEAAVPQATSSILAEKIEKKGGSVRVLPFSAEAVAQCLIQCHVGKGDVVVCMGAGTSTDLAWALPAALQTHGHHITQSTPCTS